MTEGTILVVVIVGLFFLRFVAATVIFALLLPRTDRCIDCDAPTVRVTSVLWDRVLPMFRKSWCLECGWTGLLRRQTESVTPEQARSQRVARPGTSSR